MLANRKAHRKAKFGDGIMAELCLDCFLEVWRPNAYDRAHIVMSNDNEFCESCFDCVPYVHHIAPSDARLIKTADDFLQIASEALILGRKIACVECGCVFENDDLAFVAEAGECPYCHKQTSKIWIKD